MPPDQSVGDLCERLFASAFKCSGFLSEITIS